MRRTKPASAAVPRMCCALQWLIKGASGRLRRNKGTGIRDEQRARARCDCHGARADSALRCDMRREAALQGDGSIATKPCKPHSRMDGASQGETNLRWRSGGAPRSEARKRATAGNAGKQGGRRADGGAAAKNSPPKAISRLPSVARARRMCRKTRASTPPGISRRFAARQERNRKWGTSPTRAIRG